MLRRVGLKRSRPKPWRRAEDDKVPPAVAAYVAARDRVCVMSTLDLSHQCHDQFGNVIAPDSYHYELDHVDNGGTGNRGPSTKDNLVRLCPYGHRIKTENARLWRPALRAYVAAVEGLEDVA